MHLSVHDRQVRLDPGGGRADDTLGIFDLDCPVSFGEYSEVGGLANFQGALVRDRKGCGRLAGDCVDGVFQ